MFDLNDSFRYTKFQMDRIQTDMRVVPLGSRGAILICSSITGISKLVIQAAEIEGQGYLLAFCKHWAISAFGLHQKLGDPGKWGSKSANLDPEFPSWMFLKYLYTNSFNEIKIILNILVWMRKTGQLKLIKKN